MSEQSTAHGEPVQWMKFKYRRLRGVQKRGGQVGNGDSGVHKRKKLSAKEKALLPPPNHSILVVDVTTGKSRWVKTPKNPAPQAAGRR